MNALLVPSDGTMWVDGMDTKEEEHLWDVRQSAGMVFQNPDNQIIGTVVEEDVGFYREPGRADRGDLEESGRQPESGWDD